MRFLIEVMSAGDSDAFRLRKETRDEMVRPHVKVDDSSSWALGWQILHAEKAALIQHQGGQKGFQSFTAASIERRRGFVMMTNSDNGWKVINPVTREVIDHFLAD